MRRAWEDEEGPVPSPWPLSGFSVASVTRLLAAAFAETAGLLGLSRPRRRRPSLLSSSSSSLLLFFALLLLFLVVLVA